jgi:hypothetical protein
MTTTDDDIETAIRTLAEVPVTATDSNFRSTPRLS